MLNIAQVRDLINPTIIVLGNHEGIIQSILDFDFLSGKKEPSVKMVVGAHVSKLHFFWGNEQIRIKAVSDISHPSLKDYEFDLFISVDSGRRVLSNLSVLLDAMKTIKLGVIFAEGVPERHALKIRELCSKHSVSIFGPSSVGFLVPGVLKLGAIGGTQPGQIAQSKITHQGSVAVISTSGGMTNELISFLARYDSALSFAGAVGGERFPILAPADLVKAALDDKKTKTIVFFGELGGTDEYEVGKLVSEHPRAKDMQLMAYIAGNSAELMENPPQFGHAKALAGSASETASSKKEFLRVSGFQVTETFEQFEDALKLIASEKQLKLTVDNYSHLVGRKKPLFSSGLSRDKGGGVSILGEDITQFIEGKQLTEIALGMFLGHKPRSKELIAFFDLAVKILVDHGPQVSGAVSTKIAARAGRDLPSALSSGLLTIGPKFGGAINQAALNWLGAVEDGIEPRDFVETFARNKQYISGIGHKKYRTDNPDPRVDLLRKMFDVNMGPATRFALGVESITTRKKSQLILNVDGFIAALLIDILYGCEDYSYDQIRELISTEFFNAIFIYARTTGFIAHYLDQKRLDDDLFRLPDDQISFEG